MRTLRIFAGTHICALCFAAAAQAATLTATFDETALFGNEPADPNDIISLVLEDIAGGGVSLTATAALEDPGIGSFYVAGFDAADFSGFGGILDAANSSIYSSEIAPGGVVFGTNAQSIFNGESITFSTVSSNVTTADFASLQVGFISTNSDSPNLLQGLFGGSLALDGEPPVAAVPLPAGLPLLLLGIGGLGLVGQRKRLTV